MGERLAVAASVDEVVALRSDTARAAVEAEGVAIVTGRYERCFYVAENAISPL